MTSATLPPLAGPAVTRAREGAYRVLDGHRGSASILFGAVTLAVCLVHLGRVTGYFDANRNQHLQMIFSGSTLEQFPRWDSRVSPLPADRPIVVYRDEDSAVSPTIFVTGESLFYYYIPLLFKPLGLDRPFLGLAVFLGFLMGCAAAQALFFAIRDRAVEIVAAYVLVGLTWISSFPGINLIAVYFQHFVAPLWLFSITSQAVSFLSGRARAIAILRIAALSVGLALTVVIRTSVMLAVFSGVALIVATSLLSTTTDGPRRGVRVAKGVLVALTIFATIHCCTAALSNRALASHGDDDSAVREGGHVVWHTLFCALGVLRDSRYPFEWSDYEAQSFAASIVPGVIPYSPEYEEILRRYIVETVSSDPGLLLRFLKLQASYQIWRYAAALAVLLTVLARMRRRLETGATLAVCSFLATTLGTWPIQLISIPHEIYLFQIHIGELLALCVGLAYLARRYVATRAAVPAWASVSLGRREADAIPVHRPPPAR